MNHSTMNVFFLEVARLTILLAPQMGQAADAWRAEWEKTVKAAETEGQLTLYSSLRLYTGVNGVPRTWIGLF